METNLWSSGDKQNISDILDSRRRFEKLDFHGADLRLGEELLRNSLANRRSPGPRSKTLARSARSEWSAGTGFTIPSVRGTERDGIPLLAPEDYRKTYWLFQRKVSRSTESQPFPQRGN